MLIKLFLIFLLTAVIVHFLFRETPERKPERAKKIKPPKVMQKLKMRGVVIEPTEYTKDYSLAYYDVQEKDTDYAYLNQQGYQGGGYSWEGILYGAIKITDPQLLERVELDPEADGIMINAQTRKDIEKVSYLIDRVKADKKFMLKAIHHANLDGKME